MPKFEEQKILNFSPEQLYKLVIDVENYNKFVPWCSRCKIISSEENLITANLFVKFGFYEDSYISKILHEKKEKDYFINIEQISGPFSKLDTKWSFIENENNSCILSFKIDFDFKSSFANSIITPIFTQTTKTMIKAFEERAKKIYGNN